MQYGLKKKRTITAIKVRFDDGEVQHFVPRTKRAKTAISFPDWILATIGDSGIVRSDLMKRAYNKWHFKKKELGEALRQMIAEGRITADIRPRNKGGIRYFLVNE